MLDLQTLAGLLRDDELRSKLTRLTSAKIKADIKSLQANAELSRRLIETPSRPASGGDPAERQRMLKAVVSEHLDYFSTLVDLSAAFSDRLLAMLSALDKSGTTPATTPRSLSMNLRGPLGSTLRAPFEIENNHREPITALFRLTPYVSEDGSQLVAANHAFDPPQSVVPPGGKLYVTFVQPIDGFTAERDYLATISVEGLDAMQIVVRLHVERPIETADVEPPQPQAEPAPAPVALAEPQPPPAEPAPAPLTEPSAPKRATASRQRQAAAPPPTPPTPVGRSTTRRPRRDDS